MVFEVFIFFLVCLRQRQNSYDMTDIISQTVVVFWSDIDQK